MRSKQLLYSFLILLSFRPPGHALEKAEVQVWTLSELLQFTVENSPSIALAKQQKQRARLEEDQAKSKFWPKLRLESTHGWRNQEPNPYTPSEYSLAALSLSENLWNKGIDYQKLEITRLNRRKAELRYFQQRDSACLNLTQEYYRYSQLVKSLEIQKNQQKLLKKQFDLVSNEYLQGLRSRRDFLRFKSQSQRAELDLEKQATQVEKSRLTLMALAGFREFSTSHQFQPEDNRPPMLDLFKNPAELNNTYEDQLLQLSTQITDATKNLTLKQTGPEINFNLSASSSGNNYWKTGTSYADNETKAWGALLTFNWTLWDGGETSAKEAIAHLQAESERTQIQQQQIELQAEIQKLQKQFLQLKEDFKTSEELLVLEQNNFLFLEGEYRQSKATYLDFINGVRDLADAQNRHWNNLFDLKQGIALYHYYKGSLFRYLLNESSDADEPETEEL